MEIKHLEDIYGNANVTHIRQATYADMGSFILCFLPYMSYKCQTGVFMIMSYILMYVMFQYCWELNGIGGFY